MQSVGARYNDAAKPLSECFKCTEFFHFSRHFMGIICFNFIATHNEQASRELVGAKWLWKLFFLSPPYSSSFLMPTSSFHVSNHSTLKFFFSFKTVDFHPPTRAAQHHQRSTWSSLFFLLPNMRCSINNTGDKQQKRMRRGRRRNEVVAFHTQQVCLIHSDRSSNDFMTERYLEWVSACWLADFFSCFRGL